MDSNIQFEIPSAHELASLNMESYSELLRNFGSTEWNNVEQPSVRTIKYGGHAGRGGPVSAGEFPNDYSMVVVTIWLIVIGAFFAVTMVFCVFSCLFYNKIRQWNINSEIDQQEALAAIEHQCVHHPEDDDLPSYTLVSGLPSYDDVINQLPPSYAADIRRYPKQHYIHIGYFAPSTEHKDGIPSAAFPGATQSVTIVTSAAANSIRHPNNNNNNGDHQQIDNNTSNQNMHERTSGTPATPATQLPTVAYEDEVSTVDFVAGNASRLNDLATTKQPLLRKSSRPDEVLDSSRRSSSVKGRFTMSKSASSKLTPTTAQRTTTTMDATTTTPATASTPLMMLVTTTTSSSCTPDVPLLS